MVLYTNLFALYACLNKLFGKVFLVFAPIVSLLLASLFFTFSIAWKKKKTGQRIIKPWLVSGFILLSSALVLPNPAYAVKRIHVLEYFLLSILVYYTLSLRIKGFHLFLYTALLATFLGIHDEFLQGIHPARTYGLRDMLVNALSCFGGASLCRGLQLFSGSTDDRDKRATDISVLCYLVWLLLSVLAFVVPVSRFLYQKIPGWTVLPLLASLVFFSAFFQRFGAHRYGIAAVSTAGFLLLLYPPVINALALPFY